MSYLDLSTYLAKSLKLRSIELIEIDLPQKERFVSGIGVRQSRRSLIIKCTDSTGAIGYGESSCRPDPFYSAEFLTASIQLVKQFVFPLLADTETIGEALNAMKKIRGWQFTKAAVEFALHDLIRQRDNDSIFSYWKRPALSRVPVGISMGIYEEENTMRAAIEKAQQQEYRRLKFKIKPDYPKHYLQLPNWLPEEYVSFDANGTFHQEDFERLRPFLSFNTAIEQPFPPHRADIVQASAKQLPELKTCYDEEVKSLGNLIKTHELLGVDELNIKVGRVGGLVQAMQIAEYCFAQNIPCWVGGMFETGIGRAVNIEFAARLTEAVAHDLSPSSRYFVEDVVQQPLAMKTPGYVEVEDAKDVQVDTRILAKYTVASECLNYKH